MHRCHSASNKPISSAPSLYYRTTSRGQVPQERDCVLARSRYLHDVFEMCKRGIWERELRQFMPPASLRESVNSLLEHGLIECTDSPAH